AARGHDREPPDHLPAARQRVRPARRRAGPRPGRVAAGRVGRAGASGADRSPPSVAFPAVLAELLRPPPHRGPLIAAGAVVLATGLALGELRIDVDQLAAPFHLLALGVAAVVTLALGLQAPNEGGRPPAYQSVLLVTGLLLLYPALLRLADVLGAELGDGYPAGELTWVSVVA